MSDETGEKKEVLVVASKLKAYIKGKSGLNTSDKVLEVVTAKIQGLADQAISRATADGRKTVLDRDFE